MNTRTLLSASLFCLLAAGCSDGNVRKDDYQPLGPNDSSADITIVGAGTVSYNSPSYPDCVSPGSGSYSCTRVRIDGGQGTVTATAATGWHFVGWSTTSPSSENTVTDPNAKTQSIVAGTVVSLTATFVPNVHPIKATFDQNSFSTTYVVDVDNPDLDIVKIEWSGPNCGCFDPKEGLGSEKTTTFSMTWTHPHDPRMPSSCDATTDHKNVIITAKVTIKDKTFTCDYQGADTGEGKPCK